VRRSVQATRYVTPLREGGSLPGLVEADDDGTYVVKFRGAGQGTAALVAEVVVGGLARHLGVRVPDLVRLQLDRQVARHEPDQEVQELLTASVGENLGADFLPGSVGYDGIGWHAPPDEATTIYWLDAYAANIDRTWRNPNLLIWHRRLWAIDHGAALVFQHSWPPVERWAARAYDLSQHVLRPLVDLTPAREAELTAALTPALLTGLLADVPDGWLLDMNAAAGSGLSAPDWRERYVTYLLARADPAAGWREGL
jgi:hypothetical protein